MHRTLTASLLTVAVLACAPTVRAQSSTAPSADTVDLATRLKPVLQADDPRFSARFETFIHVDSAGAATRVCVGLPDTAFTARIAAAMRAARYAPAVVQGQARSSVIYLAVTAGPLNSVTPGYSISFEQTSWQQDPPVLDDVTIVHQEATWDRDELRRGIVLPGGWNVRGGMSVVVDVMVDTAGRAGECLIERSITPEVDRAVLGAVRALRFVPAMRCGQPVAAWARVTVPLGGGGR